MFWKLERVLNEIIEAQWLNSDFIPKNTLLKIPLRLISRTILKVCNQKNFNYKSDLRDNICKS